MAKASDLFDISDPATAEFFERTDPAISRSRSYDPSHERPEIDAANENLDGCDQPEAKLTEVDEFLAIEIWKPTEPQYCRAICAHYEVKNRTVQKWFDKIVEACPWFSEAELRLPDDRYTPLCVELMGDYRASGLIARKWSAKIAEQFSDRIAAWKSASVIQPDVMPSQNGTSGIDPACAPEIPSHGMVLHLGASPDLPFILDIVPLGDDTAYLAQMQQRLNDFASLQRNAIAQMQDQYEQTRSLNAQYEEAISLSDRLLLQEFQLKGVQLGYTALQVKQQAFKSTIQSAEAGTLQAVGKSQSDPVQPQSA